jgi:tetratricopeptide (TPR) repeat protein
MESKEFHLQLLLTSLATPATAISDEDPTTPASIAALQLVQQGNYLQALHTALENLDIASKCTTQPPESALEWFDGLTTAAAAILQTDNNLSSEPGRLLSLAAVASLYIFTQANLTGPLVSVPESPFDLLAEDPSSQISGGGDAGSGGAADGAAAQEIGRDSMSLADRWACTLLAENGEDLVGRIRYPQYLLLPKLVLCLEEKDVEESTGKINNTITSASASGSSLLPPEWSWWAMRTILTQQRVLAGRSATLRQRLLSLAKTVLDYYQHPEQMAAAAAVAAGEETRKDFAERNSNLAAVALLEAAMMETAYGHVQQAKLYTDQALAHLELHAELGGALGTRTVHQQDPRAQLILQVSVASTTSTSSITDNNNRDSTQGIDGAILDEFLVEGSGSNQEVKGIADESDVLKHPKLVNNDGKEGENDGSSGENGENFEVLLTPLQQAAILALALHAKKGSSADELQPWEVLAHADAVLQQPKSEFLVRAAAHLQVTRVERQRSRTRERALLALEGLAEALDRENSSNNTEEQNINCSINNAARMRCAFALWFPLRVSLRKELGEAFVALGLVGAALPLFESLELWDNLIVCYRLLDKKVAAEQLVKRRLEVTPDEPRLWCALGDLSLDDAHYMEAWERSGKRNARAARSLARNAVRNERYEKAASHWEQALALNPLHPEGWFHLGWCCIKTKEYQGALRALTRSAQMDPENGEAWNNLAAVHIHLEHWKEAFAALTEAVKHNRNSWHTWDNYAGVAVKVGEWQAAVRALGQVVVLSQGQRLDISVLAVVVSQLERMKKGVLLGGGDAASLDSNEIDTLDNTSSALEEEPATAAGQETTAAELEMAASFEALALPPSSSSEPSLSTYAIQKAEAEERSNESFFRMVGNLMKQIASTAAGDSVFWAQFARYYTALGETDAAAECFLKRVRALQGGTWRENKEDFEGYAAACLDLSHIYLISGGKREWSQAKMLLRGAIKQAEERYEEHTAYSELQNVLKSVEQKIQQASEA